MSEPADTIPSAAQTPAAAGGPDPELAPVRDFIARTLPFDRLAGPDLDLAARGIHVLYHCRGDTIDSAAPGAGLRILRSGAVDIRDRDNKLLDRLGEGESFHIGGLTEALGPVRATVIEDALLYLLPEAVYRRLRDGNRDFDRYFTGQRNRRLRRAARYQPAPNALLREVRTVMSTILVTVGPAETVQQVAVAMSQHRVSSALVMEHGRLVGIVTDRDLRTRCIARALPAATPVATIMTPDPDTIDATDTLFSATLRMTRRGFHHLPVLCGGRTVGIVTTSDLILARQDDPVYLVQHISRQQDAAGIRDLLAGMPGLMVQWVQAGMPAAQVSRVLTAISDAVNARLIQLAEERLGPAPAPWCWAGFGSQARAEQLLGADQDNGIIIDDRVRPEQLDWYARLAHWVCDGLRDCGYPYCNGGIMASNEQWRQPLSRWQQTVRRWAAEPTPDAVMRVSIFFDLRCIHGTAELCTRLQETMLQQTSSNSIFLAALAANVLDSAPPIGIFRRFVVERDGEHRSELDLKKRGVLPVTEIVRLHALAHAIPEVNTAERLQSLVRGGHMTIADSRNLGDALDFIQQQRIHHQCAQVESGEPVSNFLNPELLPRMAREQLRDAFTIIHEAQSAVRQGYRAGLG